MADADPNPIIKLIIWDLDNSLWDGVLIEGDSCAVFPEVAEFIRETDCKGVLHSIASRNDMAAATAHLEKAGLADFFLCPQIGWGAKSQSIAWIVDRLNIGMDSVLFVDDSEFELEETKSALPSLHTLNVKDLPAFGRQLIAGLPPVTEESRKRRRFYQQQMRRDEAEQNHSDTPEAFLATLGLRMSVRQATHGDLERAAELVLRTNQLNSTGKLFSSDELSAMIDDPQRTLLIADLEDRFGDYGIVALIMIAERPEQAVVELMLVSCRVMSRGIGPILLDYLALRIQDRGRGFAVEFRDTGLNRAMKIALMMTGFVKDDDIPAIFVRKLEVDRKLPDWLHIVERW